MDLLDDRERAFEIATRRCAFTARDASGAEGAERKLEGGVVPGRLGDGDAVGRHRDRFGDAAAVEE